MKVKYFPFYESLYESVKDFSPTRFKRAIMPLLEYAFTEKEHSRDKNETIEVIFISNKPFIDRLRKNIEYGKQGGAPEGNKNAKGHGAPKGNKNAAKKAKTGENEGENEKQTTRYRKRKRDGYVDRKRDGDGYTATASVSLEANRAASVGDDTFDDDEFLSVEDLG